MPTVIANPVLNTPYAEPRRHFRFTDEGITDEILEYRRPSSYFVPIPRAKKKGKQAAFETEWTQDRVEESREVNRLRERLAIWRQGGRLGITQITRRLLDYWTDPEREKKLFFCQIEALETAIYIAEVARRYDPWIETWLRDANQDANPLLSRVAFKMATGAGKTTVMAMLIAWQALNKFANPQDARFSDAFLVVTPGITIRDRLRVLWPNDPGNYYRQRDVLPPEWLDELQKAKIVITNFHAFKARDRGEGSALTKKILTGDQPASPFIETPAQVVRRVCRDLGAKRNIVVINDEAHHCYRRRAGVVAIPEEQLTGEEKAEARKRDEEARVWISGLEAVKRKIGLRAVYDLSATPFFLRGSGYSEGTLFPWVVSDFSLIDAIESGIVKVPRVPVADDSMLGEQPTYRDLWTRIRDHLPRKGRGTEKLTGEPHLPAELEGALQSLYGNYEKYYRHWERIDLPSPASGRGAGGEGRPTGEAPAQHDALPSFPLSRVRERGPGGEGRPAGEDRTPPVFIVVCNNTNVSKLVFDYVAGWEETRPDGVTVLHPGRLPIFSNVRDGRWLDRPNTILVDSQQLESGEAMSDDFKKIAAAEIAEFKAEYRARFPGRDPEELTDEDLLREVMNTVGKPGKLGEGIRCVVSVSMLTEGWDANTVSHILGVRAFGTQLLCEQVVGRGLRRRSYAADDDGMLSAEYAEVYGVPFSFIPTSGSTADPRPGPMPTRVHAIADRIEREITFPRVIAYAYDFPEEHLDATFTGESDFVLSTEHVPTITETAPIVGESVIHDLSELQGRREQEVAFRLASLVLERYFRDKDGYLKPWLFPQLLRIARSWLRDCVRLKDNTFVQLLLLIENANHAAEKIYRSIAASATGQRTLRPVLRPYDAVGSTRYVDFDTVKTVWPTSPEKCHVSHATGDSNWENKMASALEEMPEVIAYVKNQGLGFTIPYALGGIDASYIPDYIVRLDDGRGPEDPLNLVLEVSGERKKDKEAKVATARTLWVPAVNNHGGFGRWAFLEVTDPWDAKNTIRALVGPHPPSTGSGHGLAPSPGTGRGGTQGHNSDVG